MESIFFEIGSWYRRLKNKNAEGDHMLVEAISSGDRLFKVKLIGTWNNGTIKKGLSRPFEMIFSDFSRKEWERIPASDQTLVLMKKFEETEIVDRVKMSKKFHDRVLKKRHKR